FGACVHRESPVGSVLVEPQDIERAVGAFDLAIAVIGAEPLIEDFNDLDHASIHSESPRHGQTVGFAAVDLNAHAFASAAPMIANLIESESHRPWAVGVWFFSANVGRRSNIVITNFLSGRATAGVERFMINATRRRRATHNRSHITA